MYMTKSSDQRQECTTVECCCLRKPKSIIYLSTIAVFWRYTVAMYVDAYVIVCMLCMGVSIHWTGLVD